MKSDESELSSQKLERFEDESPVFWHGGATVEGPPSELFRLFFFLEA